MNQALTLGQQLAMSANSGLAASYIDPRSEAMDIESKDVRAAANLTLLTESVKTAIRKQIADNLSKGSSSDIATYKVMSTAVCYDILMHQILVQSLVRSDSKTTTVWESFLNWLRDEGLALVIDSVSSPESVRPWYELTVRIKN